MPTDADEDAIRAFTKRTLDATKEHIAKRQRVTAMASRTSWKLGVKRPTWPARCWAVSLLLLLLTLPWERHRRVPDGVRMMFGNITEWGPQAERFLESPKLEGFDGLAFVELHANSTNAIKVIKVARDF